MTGQQRFDAIVLGAGAAGLMCAAVAGQRGQRVLVIERAEAPGKKILISGGGRCNFTNLQTAPDRFLSDNPGFCISALSRYRPQDFIALVERHGIAYHEKKLGQLFCDGSARRIVEMLLAECRDGAVELRLGTEVREVARDGDMFRIETSDRTALAARLVVATGGLSIPKMGASGLGYEIARRFGLRIVEPRPALVPFVFTDAERARAAELAGVALPDVEVRAGRGRFREALLFTHRGLSGPAILQASSYWRPGEPVTVDLLPGRDPAALLKDFKATRPQAMAKTPLADLFPARFAERLAQDAALDRSLAATRDRELNRLAERLRRWTLHPEGTEGWRTAEVTAGGVDTRDLSSRTLEAVKVPGLHFIGEVVDVTGWLGGYNFQWAWASGVAAGQAIRHGAA